MNVANYWLFIKNKRVFCLRSFWKSFSQQFTLFRIHIFCRRKRILMSCIQLLFSTKQKNQCKKKFTEKTFYSLITCSVKLRKCTKKQNNNKTKKNRSNTSQIIRNITPSKVRCYHKIDLLQTTSWGKWNNNFHCWYNEKSLNWVKLHLQKKGELKHQLTNRYLWLVRKVGKRK